MAFPVFQVTCMAAGAAPADGAALPLPGEIYWNEAPSSGTVSSNRAPDPSNGGGTVIFQAFATQDSYLSISVGTPNAAGAQRVPVPARVLVEIRVKPGAQFAWQAA